ncbi:MAG TPA: sterol desaturase family protein, partial [Mariniflexile sp.]
MNLPSPIDIILNPVFFIVIGLYGLLIVWEALFPARPLQYIKNWKIKGIIAFFIYFFLSTYFPILWDAYLMQFQVFDLTILGTYWGALIAFVIYQLGLYTWHRAMHKSDFLWRIFHQMHHSSERMDSYSAFYFSLMDMIGFTFLSSLCLVVVAGFTAEATTIFILAT